MSMIFQNPRAALNPIRKVGRQIEDVLRQHAQVDSTALTAKAIEILDQVRIARPRERYHAYPFELSGGMCQRVVIALALACKPQLLIADEPTTGLDVTTQKTVMDLVTELTRERGMSTILITHDLGLAAAYCDRVVVMQKGRAAAAPRAEAFGEHFHALVEFLPLEIAVGVRAAHQGKQFVFGPLAGRHFGRDLLRQNIERVFRYLEPVQFAAAHRMQQRCTLDEFVARQRKQTPFGYAADLVPGTSYPLQE